MRATREVENNISRMAMLPASRDSKHFANGSVVKMRNPREVPEPASINCTSAALG